ncbi:hypothetical protein QUB63_01080 [Microcoleus sp. ARI1-B5]
MENRKMENRLTRLVWDRGLLLHLYGRSLSPQLPLKSEHLNLM